MSAASPSLTIWWDAENLQPRATVPFEAIFDYIVERLEARVPGTLAGSRDCTFCI